MDILWRWPLALLIWLLLMLIRLLLWFLASPALSLIWFGALCYLYAIIGHPDWFVIGCVTLLLVVIIRSGAKSILNNWAVSAPKAPKPRKIKKKRPPPGIPASQAAPASPKQESPVMVAVSVPSKRWQNTRLRTLFKRLPEQLQMFLARAQHLHGEENGKQS